MQINFFIKLNIQIDCFNGHPVERSQLTMFSTNGRLRRIIAGQWEPSRFNSPAQAKRIDFAAIAIVQVHHLIAAGSHQVGGIVSLLPGEVDRTRSVKIVGKFEKFLWGAGVGEFRIYFPIAIDDNQWEIESKWLPSSSDDSSVLWESIVIDEVRQMRWDSSSP